MPRKLIITPSSPSGGGGTSIESLIALSAQSVPEELGPNVVIANIVMPPNSGTWSFEVPADKNAGGRVQVVGATLRTTNVKFDYEGVKQYTIRVIATRQAPSYLQIDKDFVINVTNVAGDTLPVELDFINDTFSGGAAAANLTRVGPAKTVKNNLNQDVAIAANAIADSDIGVWVDGKSATHYVGRALRPDDANGWTFIGEAWATKDITPVPGLATSKYPYPARMTGNNAYEGRIRPPVLASPAAGSSVVVHVGVMYDESVANPANTFSLRMSWNGGANTETWNVQFLDPDHVNALSLVNAESGYTPNGVISAPIRAVRGADGWTELAFAVNNVPANDFIIDFIRRDQDTDQLVVGYANMYAGTEILPLRDTGAGPGAEVVTADDYTLAGPLAAILAGAAGTVTMEVQALSYDTIGVTGMGAASVAGTLLKVGAQNLLRPDGPTAVKGPAGTSRPLGISGWRGIVIVGMAWDATGVSVYANGGKILSSAGITPAGTVKLLAGITGRIRRLAGSNTKMSNAQLRELTSITNKEFVRPGNALAPGVCNLTHWNDYDNGINSALRRQSVRAPNPAVGQPWYADGDAMAASYDLGDALTGEVDFGTAIFIPRYHFHNWHQAGQGDPRPGGVVAAINEEPAAFMDPVGSGGEAVVTHEVANSAWRLRLRLTSSLTAGQQALVPFDPANPSQRMKYVGAAASTYKQFTQRFGVFSSRDKMPGFSGGWPAWWLYSSKQSEIDIEEYYGDNITNSTDTKHEPYLTGPEAHKGNNTSIGFDLGQDFHDRTLIWKAGFMHKYLNGERIGTHAQSATFDTEPMWLLYDFALYPPHVDAATDAYLAANPNAAIEIDRTSVFQFAA